MCDINCNGGCRECAPLDHYPFTLVAPPNTCAIHGRYNNPDNLEMGCPKCSEAPAMPIKFTKIEPPPQPLPPPTYSITGLSKQQAKWLREAINFRIKALSANSVYTATREEADFLRRVEAVIIIG